MQSRKHLGLLVAVILMLAGIVGCGASSPAATVTDTPTLATTATVILAPTDTPMPTLSPGIQIHTNAGGLGMFTLTLASDNSAIIEFNLAVNDLQCGSTHVSQTSVDVSNVWPITQQAFHIDAANNSLLDVVIAGRVDTDFHHASGTWTGNAFGSTCSGSWLG